MKEIYLEDDVYKHRSHSPYIILISLFLISCVSPQVMDQGGKIKTTGEMEEKQSTLQSEVSEGDILLLEDIAAKEPTTIFFNGNILTMVEAIPVVQALAIWEDTILAIGTNSAVLDFQGDGTEIIDLNGLTMLPGFIDSHVHRIGDRNLGGIESTEESIQLALQQGYTSMVEMFVNQDRLDELRELDRNGMLRLRVDAYLPLNYDQPKFGSWYQAYQAGDRISSFLRIAGLKIFMDHGWGKGELLWTKEELDQTLKEASDLGWQVAAHSVGEPAASMLLDSIERIHASNPGKDYRFRLEHGLVISDEDVKRMAALDVLASVQLHGPTSWPMAYDDFYPEVSPDLYPRFTRYRDLAEAGVMLIGSSDWPWGKLEADFGSSMKLLYQAVTRMGAFGQEPDEWMRGQEIPIELALRSLTINGAYGIFQEDIMGSISPGKLSDLVVLSKNPLSAPIEEVPNIMVLMTMVGGKVEWCADDSSKICLASQTISSESGIGSLPFGHIDKPSAGETVSGEIEIFGWALDEDGNIDHVEIYIDGDHIGDATYGVSRQDVANDYPNREGSPNFGYSFQWDTTAFANGTYQLSVKAIGPGGDEAFMIPGTVLVNIEN